VVLFITQDLMKKAQDIFLEHFARLGMFGRVQDLAGPLESEATAIKEEKVRESCDHYYNANNEVNLVWMWAVFCLFTPY
jgi:hypothetical protein